MSSPETLPDEGAPTPTPIAALVASAGFDFDALPRLIRGDLAHDHREGGQYLAEDEQVRRIRGLLLSLGVDHAMLPAFRRDWYGDPADDDDHDPRPTVTTADPAAPWWAAAEAFTGLPEALPAILTRDDGAPLVYTGKTSWIYGEPGRGKSWAALIVALRADCRVLYLDFEDQPQTLAARARLLAGDSVIAHLQDADWFRYVAGYDIRNDDPDEPPGVIRDAVDWLAGGVVIIDTAGSSGCPAGRCRRAPVDRPVRRTVAPQPRHCRRR